MNHPGLKKLIRHNKRLQGLSFPRKLHYVGQVLFGEVLRRRFIDPFGPRLIEITLTHRCQCQCVHCYDETSLSAQQQPGLTKTAVVSILDQASRLGCTEICFTGGEPTLHRDLPDLIRYSRKLQMVPKMNTNGILLTPNFVSRLKVAGLTWCSVSIDSPQPEKHDQLRRYEGCFEKAIEGLRELVRQNIPASITTIARKNRINSEDLEKIIALGQELHVETVRILFPVPMGGFHNAQNEVLDFEERERVRKLLSKPIVTMESPFEKAGCTAAVTKFNILPDGNVTPCVFVPLSYGNIHEEPLKDIWKRMSEFDRCCKPAGKCPMCNAEFRAKVLNRCLLTTEKLYDT
jgi:MoaA/NifB/PqqE/SkfB family radical SAM enzyme